MLYGHIDPDTQATSGSSRIVEIDTGFAKIINVQITSVGKKGWGGLSVDPYVLESTYTRTDGIVEFYLDTGDYGYDYLILGTKDLTST
jgi:hypothetical protein